MIFDVKRSAFLFVALWVFLLLPKVCFAENITVDLVWKFPNPAWLEIEVRQGVYQVEFNNAGQDLQVGENLKIGESGITLFVYQGKEISILEKPVIRLKAKGSGIFRVREPGKDWVSYRGDLVITREKTHWKLLNTLDREDYLKGVVPIEMSNAWAAKGFEALKAQAVAARTYLLKNINANGIITDSPNIHQAYWGRSVEGEATRAVEATKGEILADVNTGKPISIFYSSHNGGFSEETQNVWQNHDPHYTATPDPYSEGIGGMVNQWRFLVAADVLGRSFGLAPIREVNLKKYPSGRVYEVSLLDWLGNEKAVSGGDFVGKFYPYDREISAESFLGRLFQVSYILPDLKKSDERTTPFGSILQRQTENIDPGPILSRLKSSNEGLSEEPREFGVFVFNGRGWGHGVGMSQWGAYNMAMKGYSYKDILAYYYQNSVLVQKP